MTDLWPLLLAIAVGLLVNYLWDKRTVLKKLIRRSRSLPNYDPASDNLFLLNEWAADRRLTPRNLRIETRDKLERPTQNWFPDDLWEEAVSRHRRKVGNLCYIVDYEIDWKEHVSNEDHRVVLAPSDYSEQMAAQELIAAHPNLAQHALAALRDDPLEYVRRACPTSISANVVVHASDRRRLLAVKRSALVDTAKGLWTIGIFEMMKMPHHSDAGMRDDFFSLADRALREELGLESEDYGEVHISWLGIYGPLLRGHIVAHIRLRIPQAEIQQRLHSASHGDLEAVDIDWIPLDLGTVRQATRARLARRSNTADVCLTFLKREWLDQSRLALWDAYRSQTALGV